MSTISLDVGCGLNTKKPLDDWVHLDCDEGPHIEWVTDFADIPTEDESVSEIWIGDVIEHIPAWRHDEVLTEWRRVLVPNGKLNGTTPNLEWAIYAYTNGVEGWDLGWLLQNLYGDRAGPPHQHYIIYTTETLDTFLQGKGFGPVDFNRSPGPPDNPWWLVFETHKL